MTTDAATTRRRGPVGRRSGDSGTREAILDAAGTLFAERGYDGASLRAIAAAAGVDPALIRHFFGDKQTLFMTVVADRSTVIERLAGSLQGDQDAAGRRMTDTYLRLWEEPQTRPVLMALVRSATTSEHAAGMLRDLLLGRVREKVGAPDDERMRGIAIAGAHLLGVAIARHVVRLPPIAALGHDALVDEVAPTIQRYLTGTHTSPA